MIIDLPQLDDARALLYRVYHEEQGWSPPAENPSQQAIVRLGPGSFGLADRFDYSATWLGLVHEEQIVGCVRLIDRTDHPALELEGYFSLPHRLSREHLIEVNRLAILPRYRRTPAALLLISRALEIATCHHRAVITAATRRSARFLMVATGIHDTGLHFHYHASEEPAVVLVLPASCVEPQRARIDARLSKWYERLAESEPQCR